jgi:hypothetical protein
VATSEYEYRVLVDTNDIGGTTHALDARTSRIIVSNINHLSDEFAQVLSCRSGTVPALSGKSGYLTTNTPTFAGTPYLVTADTVPIKVRAGGQSYRIRVRVGGASGNTASTVFYVAAAPVGMAPASIVTSAGAIDSIYQTAATTSSTAAWLTGASRGPNAYTTMIEMTATQVEACVVTRPTLTALGGDSSTVQVALVQLSVWATTANVAHVPRLYALSAAEVIGT